MANKQNTLKNICGTKTAMWQINGGEFETDL